MSWSTFHRISIVCAQKCSQPQYPKEPHCNCKEMLHYRLTLLIRSEYSGHTRSWNKVDSFFFSNQLVVMYLTHFSSQGSTFSGYPSEYLFSSPSLKLTVLQSVTTKKDKFMFFSSSSPFKRRRREKQTRDQRGSLEAVWHRIPHWEARDS